jgi:hypothetical protein
VPVPLPDELLDLLGARACASWRPSCPAARRGYHLYTMSGNRMRVLRTNIGNVATLDEAVAALNPTGRRKGKTIISVRP